MTIYSLEVNTANLSRLRSAKVVIDVCVQICSNIFQHFHSQILAHSQSAQNAIVTGNVMMQWYLGIIGRAIPAETVDRGLPFICFLYVERYDISPAKDFRQAFTLQTLKDVCPKVLLDIMYQLVRDSLRCIAPSIKLMTSAQIAQWTNRILEITRNLSFLNGVVPAMDNPKRVDFTSLMLKFELDGEPHSTIDLVY